MLFGPYLIFILPAVLLSAWAQANVNGTFNRFSRVLSPYGLTGASAARRILDANGLYNVRIEMIRGKLSDHYDPVKNVIRLSEQVFNGASVSSVGVAAHEAGHAVQYATGYAPIRFRSTIIPVTRFGSALAAPLIIIGFLLSSASFVFIGIILFSLAVLFQLVTLPVEFNASSRAVEALEKNGILSGESLDGARRVLRAAALTYLAAMLVSLVYLLQYLLMFAGMRRRD